MNTRVYYDLKGLNLISLEVDAYYATTRYVLITFTYARDIDHKRLYCYTVIALSKLVTSNISLLVSKLFPSVRTTAFPVLDDLHGFEIAFWSLK